jgi:hypothetical protein
MTKLLANEELVLTSTLSEAPARFARWRFIIVRSQHNSGRYADERTIVEGFWNA